MNISSPSAASLNPRETFSRREVISSLVGSSLLLPGIVSNLLADSAADPLAPKPSHFPARAKRVIFIFSNGGVSHMDTFDYKPKLFAADGQTMGIGGRLSNQQRRLLKPGWAFKPGGKSGTLVSDLFPHLRECMDDICLIFNNDFLPAYHQGVRVVPGKEPIANLDRRMKQSSVRELDCCLDSSWGSRITTAFPPRTCAR